MGARKLAYHVSVTDPDGDLYTFGPEDELPAWARKAITNESAWGEVPDGSTGDADDSPEPEKGYGEQTKAELRAEIDRRNADRSDDGQIEVTGSSTKAELVAALEADDEVGGQA